MNIKTHILGEAGFSLVQGMILAAVLAGSALVATRLLSDQKMAQKTMETRDQIEDLHAIIYSTLQRRESCTATFAANLGGPANVINALTTGATPDVLNTITLDNGDVTARRFLGTLNVTDAGRNTYMNGNVIITGMNVTYTVPNSTATLRMTYERLANSDAKRTKTGYGAKTITKDITLRVQRNPFVAGKPFVACYALTMDKTAEGSSEAGNDVNEDFCKEMNGGVEGDGTTTGLNIFVWDPTTNTCIPNSKCPDHLIYTGFTNTGTVICKTLQTLLTERPAVWSTIFQPTVGTCGPGKTVRLIASPDRTKVYINCQ